MQTDLTRHHQDEESAKRMGLFNEIIRRNPNVVIVDKPERILPLLNRESIHQMLETLEVVKSRMLNVPKQIRCETVGQAAKDVALQHGLRFPLIVKSVAATDAPGAHAMALVYNPDSLVTLGVHVPAPLILQEFVSHNATTYKVFVIGGAISIVTRQSLPNVEASDAPPHLFDSQDTLFKSRKEVLLKDYTAQIAHIADALRISLDLTMFGFDLIFAVDDDRPYVFDINYFPGYDGVDNLNDKLLDNFLEQWRLHTQQQQQQQ